MGRAGGAVLESVVGWSGVLERQASRPRLLVGFPLWIWSWPGAACELSL